MTATAPLLDRCPACGQQSESDSSCTRCGASLWVDLWLDGPAPDRRTCFLAARDLAALELPGGGFARLKESLAVTGEPFAVAVPRREARAALDALRRRGLGATARASARTTPRRSRARVAMLAGAAALVLVAAGALVRMRQGPGEPPAQAHAAASALVADERGPLAPPVAAAGPPPENRLTTQDLTTLAIDSVAEVSCGAQGGTAFFVTPEHAATNAHVTCGKDVPLQVRFKNGRQLLGKPVTIDEKRDVAVLEVPGAGARPLPLGDSTALAPGDHLVLLGNPQGFAFTAHEARVSYVGRNLFGNAYVQLNGDVNPGNSGGPLLDGAGRVVGIVSMKVTNADGIGLALPVEYLRSLVAGVPPPPAEAQVRWTETLRRVHEEDSAEVETYRVKYRRPAIAAVGMRPQGGLFVVVLRRWDGSPWQLPITVDVRSGAKTLCSSASAVEDWEPVEQSLKRALRDAPDQLRLVWAIENRTMRDVMAGSAPLNLQSCMLDEVPASAVLTIRDGDESDTPIRFPRPSLVEASVRIQEAQDRARTVREASQQARDETGWRNAFHRSRTEIATLEGRRESLRRRAATYSPTSDPNEPRKQLVDVEERLARANEALQDLERRASAAAVPRAWRE